MDFLDRILKAGVAFRSSLENPKTPLSNPASWLMDALGVGDRVASGTRVNAASAMGLAGFWGCIKIISETMGSLPLHTYRDLGNDEKEIARDRQEYWMLANEFNPLMTSMIGREVMQAHILCWGNAYALKRYNGAYKVESLWPLQPSKTRATTTAGQLVYETTDTPSGKRVEYANEDVLHVPGLSFDGLHGLSPIQVHRETLGLGIATERYGASFFGSGE